MPCLSEANRPVMPCFTERHPLLFLLFPVLQSLLTKLDGPDYSFDQYSYDARGNMLTSAHNDGMGGYKVHFTETCADDEAHFITAIQTTIATDQDVDVVCDIHSGLKRLDLQPHEHLVDTAYVAADLATESFNQHGIELLGPTRVDTSWQSLEPDAFALKDFVIDWEKREITCPMGKVSTHWKPSTITRNKRQRKTIQVQFTRKTCADCPCRDRCTRSKITRHGITLHPTQQEHEMLQQARDYQQTDEFQERYKNGLGLKGRFLLPPIPSICDEHGIADWRKHICTMCVLQQRFT